MLIVYLNFKLIWHNFFFQGNAKDMLDKPCGDVILNADRAQIVLKTHLYIQSLWDDSDCKSMYLF